MDFGQLSHLPGFSWSATHFSEMLLTVDKRGIGIVWKLRKYPVYAPNSSSAPVQAQLQGPNDPRALHGPPEISTLRGTPVRFYSNLTGITVERAEAVDEMQ